MYIKTSFQKSNSMIKINTPIKLILLMLSIFLFASCTSNKGLSNSKVNRKITPDYLEETQITSQDTIYAQIDSLNNIVLPPYKLEPGDKMKIYVYDEPELDTDVVIVKEDGTLSFRLVGEVQVGGLTIAEATTLLEHKLQAYLLYPKVSIILIETRNSTVTLLGKVMHPGTFKISGSMRVLDAIANAGGFALGYYPTATIELADLERTFLTRDNKILPIDFVELVQKGNTRYNIPLIDKDYIYVPSATSKEIYILGEVNLAGHFFYQENMTLLQSISFAQGFKSTAISTVYVIRGSLSSPHLYKIHVRAIMHARKFDFALQPNDIIFVPKNPIAKWNDVVTMALPSLQAFQSAWFVNDMIQKAGGN